MIGKSFLFCVGVVWREKLFSSSTAGTRAPPYYNGTLRPVQDGKNLRQRTKIVNEVNVKLSFQILSNCLFISTSNKLKLNDCSKGD